MVLYHTKNVSISKCQRLKSLNTNFILIGLYKVKDCSITQINQSLVRKNIILGHFFAVPSFLDVEFQYLDCTLNQLVNQLLLCLLLLSSFLIRGIPPLSSSIMFCTMQSSIKIQNMLRTLKISKTLTSYFSLRYFSILLQALTLTQIYESFPNHCYRPANQTLNHKLSNKSWRIRSLSLAIEYIKEYEH